MRSTVLAVTAALALFLSPPEARAQVWPESPILLAPGSPSGFGVYLMDAEPGNGIGVLATWRGQPAPAGPGFRVGLAEDFRDEVAVLGAFDLSGYLYRATDEFPLDVLWLTGAGLSVGDDVLLSIPLGVSLGRVLESEGIRLLPYLAPRLSVDAFFGEDVEGDAPPFGRRGDDDLDLNFALDLGLDLSFGADWAIRFGATVGDHDALAIGLSFPGLR